MIMDHIIEELKKLLGSCFVAVEIGSWYQDYHYIHIIVSHLSLYQIMEITRITGDPNPQMFGGYDYNIKIIADVKRKI